MKKNIIFFVVLFCLAAIVFKMLPISEHDYLRLRYFIGLWLLAEAAFLFFPGEARQSLPLYHLVWRYPEIRDKIAAGLALAVFFTVLYLAVWYLMDNQFLLAVKIGLAIATVLVSWLVYYGICFLFGTRDLRYGGAIWFIRKQVRRDRKS